MRKIYIDIETIPTQSPTLQSMITESIKPPGNIKKQETIQKWMQEDRPQAIADALDKASFDGATNHIVCIGVAVDDGQPGFFSAESVAQEKGLLEEFHKLIAEACGKYHNTVFVGHNLINFDLRVIKQRSMVLGVRPCPLLPFNAKPWDSNVYDTMTEWAGVKDSVKLDKLAQVFGIAGKTTDGSQVQKMFLDGKHKEIADYCMDDVRITREVYKRMNFIAPVVPNEGDVCAG